VEDHWGKAGRRGGLRGLPLFVSRALLDNRSPPAAGAKQALSLRGAAHCDARWRGCWRRAHRAAPRRSGCWRRSAPP
jgi:hypothetical protein